MRTLTTNETAALNSPQCYFYLRCQIKDAAGTWRNTATLMGWQWMVSANVNEDVDAITSEATIELRRAGPGKDTYLSTAPGAESSPINLLTGSYNPLVALFREIKLELAILPQDVVLQESDFKLWFHGRIDSYDSAIDIVSISARDLGGYLVDCFIEVERWYADPSPVTVQSLIQSILNDNLTSITPPTLRTVGSPSWNITKYKQQKMAVMAACQTVAQQNGWALRYAYDSSDGTFKLTYSSPNRSATSGVLTVTASEYWQVDTVTQHVAGIRNVVQVWYFDSADLDNSGKRKRKSLLSASDAAQTSSISKYGRRWMQLAEDESSLIDSASEAQIYADAIKADLCEPLVDVEVECRLLPHLELGDMITFQANNVHFTSNQTLAIVGMTHTIGSVDDAGARKERTTLRLRGKPVAKWLGWLELDAGRNGVPTAAELAMPTPTGVSVVAAIAGAEVKFTIPDDPRLEWFEAELHVSISSGFTPSSSTLKVKTNTNAFHVTGLTPGVTHYVKVISRNRYDVVSPASSELSVVPLYLPVRMVNPETDNLVLLPANGEFTSWSQGVGAIADQWVVDSGSYGSSSQVYRNDLSVTGAYSVMFRGQSLSGAIHTAALMPVIPYTYYQIELYWQKTATLTHTSESLVVEFSFYDSSRSQIALHVFILDLLADPNPVGTWKRHNAMAPSHANARFCALRIRRPGSTSGSGHVLIDNVVFSRAFTPHFLYSSTVLAPGTGWTNYISPADVRHEADSYTVFTGGFLASGGGATTNLGTLDGTMPYPTTTQVMSVIMGGATPYPGQVTVTSAGVLTLISGSVAHNVDFTGARYKNT